MVSNYLIYSNLTNSTNSERLHKRRREQDATTSGLPYISCITHRMAPTIPTTMPITHKSTDDTPSASTPEYCQGYAVSEYILIVTS
jgi:hypothetical protein